MSESLTERGQRAFLMGLNGSSKRCEFAWLSAVHSCRRPNSRSLLCSACGPSAL
jgi:hypothetical protein